jgi:hypothetical protein
MRPTVKKLTRERRVARRRTLKMGLRIRLWKNGTTEERGESVNVSASGIYFATDSTLREGETVEVLFEMPRDITGEPPTEWRCTGHVVRVDSGAKAGSPAGVAVRFDCYEVARCAFDETAEIAGRVGNELVVER